MMIHEVTTQVGRYKPRKRIGRGRGSGHGKTSGRGHNGQRSRSGFSRKAAFEGGQMPYFRRIAKRGFTNSQFTTRFWIANLRDIVALDEFAKGGEVTAEALAAAGLIRDAHTRPLKVLGDLGTEEKLTVKLTVKAARVTASAKKAIEAAGGSVEETGSRRDRIRGIDRSSDDLTPKNLTKKRKRLEASARKAAEMAKKAEAIGKNRK